MKLKICKFHIITILLLWNLISNLYAVNLPDSLISPRHYGITYDSPKTKELKKYYERILSLAKAEKNSNIIALSSIYLAENYRYEGLYDSSTFLLNKAKEYIINDSIINPEINYQYYKAKASISYFLKGGSKTMIKYCDSALLIAHQQKFDSIEISDINYIKSSSYYLRKIYDSALYFIEVSIKSYPERLPKKWLYDNINEIYLLCKVTGQLKKAETTLFEALKNCDPNYPAQKSRTYNNFGELYIEVNDYEKSLHYFKLKIEHDSSYGILDSISKSNIYHKIGNVYKQQLDFKKALISYNQALTLLGEQKHPTTQLIEVYSSLGETYLFLDSIQKSKKILEYTVKLCQELNENEIYYEKAFALLKLGRVEANYLQNEKGIEYIKEGIRLLEIKFGKKHPILRFPYSYLSIAYSKLYQDYDKAMEYIYRAHQFNSRIPIKYNLIEKIDQSESINYQSTTAALGRQITILHSWILNEKSLSKLDTLYISLYNTINSYVEACELLRNRINNNESKLTKSSQAKYFDLKALKGLQLLYNKTGNLKYLERIFEYTSINKAKTLQESLVDSKAKYSLIPDSLIQLEIDYSMTISELNNLIDKEFGKEKPDNKNICNWKKLLNETHILRDQLITQFEIDYPEYYKLKHNKQFLSVSEVQNNLKENQVLIEYSLLNDSSIYIFGISKDVFKFIPLKADEKLFQNLEELLDLIKNDNILQFNAELLRKFQTSSYYLYNSLIQPLSDLIDGKELIINPDEQLWYLPFEVLLTDTLDQSKSYGKLPYLIKKNPINYAYSTQLLFDQNKNKIKSTDYLLAVVPSYDKNIDFGKEILENNITDRSNFSPLNASIDEAEYIHHLLGGKLLKADEASEKNFKDIAERYSIIHLAMHAIVDNKLPQYSKLVFTQGVDTSEDNFLNTYEIYNKSLSAQMVVLSSCNSGSGKMQKGEGIISIARAFLYAGCPSLVITLWSVNDRSSAKLMQNYYDFLKQGMNKSTALQQSKIKFLESASPIHQHPYFWASYTVIGSNDPIELKQTNNIYYILLGIFLFALIFSKKIGTLFKFIKN